MNHLNRQKCWGRIGPHSRPFIIVAGAATCFALLVAAPGGSDQWPYIKAPVAFTLTIRVTDYQRNSAGDLAQLTTQAQRSDGSTVSLDTWYLSPSPRTFRVIGLPDGTHVTLVDAAQAKSTCRPKHREVGTAPEMLSALRKPPNCLGPSDKLLGRAVFFSQQVDVVKTWDRGSRGQEWLAPALGCKEFQWQNATSRPDGSRRILGEGKLVRFTLGEPDVRLFALGIGYAEVKPSELLRRQMKAVGVPWSSGLAQEGVHEDEALAAKCQETATSPQ